MDSEDNQKQMLQQIPVLPLRGLIFRIMKNAEMSGIIQERYHTLFKRHPKDFYKAMERTTREQLTALISASPEISAREIIDLFEEYRYGRNPSFNIYLFTPNIVQPIGIAELRNRFVIALEAFNTLQEQEELPRVRRLALSDVGLLQDRKDVFEGTYLFQSKLDYIDDEEVAVSTYETLYGFFWINLEKGYVIIQARHPEIMQALRDALGDIIRILLTPLVITKPFKNSLSFLKKNQLRSVRLHDPIHGSNTYDWLSITDDKPYEKGYQALEEMYPEVRSARYRTVVAAKKETTLTLHCYPGGFSLAGAISASIFRDWCLRTLEEIVEVYRKFKTNLAIRNEIKDLENSPVMNRFTGKQKDMVIDLMAALLTAKSGGGGSAIMNISPLDLASDLDEYVTIQVPRACVEPGCDPSEEFRIECSVCQNKVLSLHQVANDWYLTCPNHPNQPWNVLLPLSLSCPRGHVVQFGKYDLVDSIEVLPGLDLLQVISDGLKLLQNNRYAFSPSQEAFIIRSYSLIYYPDIAKAQSRMTVIQNIENMNGGWVVGVSTASREKIPA